MSVNKRTTFAHRVAWIAFKGPIPPGLFVLHKCDVRSCVNPDHLFLGSNYDNVADMVAKGRHPKGETHGRHVLKDADVAEIRAERSSGATLAQIAARFGIHLSYVGHIANRKCR
jgi:hypothetical protein